MVWQIFVPPVNRLQAKLHSAIELDQIIVLEAECLKDRIERELLIPTTESFSKILDSIARHAIQNAEFVTSVKKELADLEI